MRFIIAFLLAAILTFVSVTNSFADTNNVSAATSSKAVKSVFQLSPADWAAWAQAIASIVNLALVLWLFVWANCKHRKEREQDFKDRETERKARVAGFWIEELIMRPNHDFIQKFFDSFEIQLKGKASANVGTENHEDITKKASAEIEAFKAEYHKLTNRIVEPLQWVHNDFCELLPIIEQIEDLVTAEFSKIPGISQAKNSNDHNKKIPADRLTELRRQFFQTIHKVQTKVVLISPQDGL